MPVTADVTFDLVSLVFWLFDKTSNPIVFVPTFCMLFCFVWSLVSRFVRSL